MDILSKLLYLMPVTGKLETRCHFSPPWCLEYAASGPDEIPYHILLRGSAHVDDGSHPITVMQAGDILLIPSGVPHLLYEKGDGPVNVKSMRCVKGLQIRTNSTDLLPVNMLCGKFILPASHKTLFEKTLPKQLVIRRQSNNLSNNPDIDEEISSTRLARLVNLMHEEALEQGPASQQLMHHLSGALFCVVMRLACSSDAPPTGILRLSQRPRLEPAFNAIFEDYAKPWTSDELAALCLMSRATFARQFTEAAGKSASELLIDIRMTKASKQLAETSDSIATVAQDSGYKSDAAFQKAFKRHTGITPAQWRAMSLENIALSAECGPTENITHRR